MNCLCLRGFGSSLVKSLYPTSCAAADAATTTVATTKHAIRLRLVERISQELRCKVGGQSCLSLRGLAVEDFERAADLKNESALPCYRRAEKFVHALEHFVR